MDDNLISIIINPLLVIIMDYLSIKISLMLKPIGGKISSMRAHFKKCQFIALEVCQLAKDDRILHKEIAAPQVAGAAGPSSSLLALPTLRLQPSPLLIPTAFQAHLISSHHSWICGTKPYYYTCTAIIAT